jgi:hypothetical protein
VAGFEIDEVKQTFGIRGAGVLVLLLDAGKHHLCGPTRPCPGSLTTPTTSPKVDWPLADVTKNETTSSTKANSAASSFLIVEKHRVTRFALVAAEGVGADDDR